ncbi:MAG: peptidylprolyl isomerase [Gammaproteobacteria bacterium]
MYRILCLCFCGLFFALLNAAAVAAVAAPLEPVDKIVAVVNDDVITSTELANRLHSIKEQLKNQSAPIPPDADLKRQVLDRMILASLQLQLADKNGIRVDDETLNRTIERIAQDNKLTLPQFRSVLEREGYDFATFREDIRREITISRVQQRQVNDRITVTDQEIDNFLAAQRAHGNTGAEYHLAHILIAVPDAASAERIQAARRRAEDVLKRLRAGANFQETAIAMSDGQQALQGGDLGWRKAEELPTLFVEPVMHMKTGDISDLIRSPSGFHIIKLLDQRNDQRHIVTQTHARHILIRTDELTNDAAARARLNDIRKHVQDGADFGELARKFSSDTATATNGGDLGWVNPGDMVPSFQAQMDKLATGELSQPFKTRFGWHIVQVLGRRRHDDTTAFVRSQARKAIRQRKAEEELQSWLARLRDDAYVENRLTQAKP